MTRRRPPAEGEDFAADAVASLAKRAKAIRHSGAKLEWRDVVEIEDGVESEVARVDVEISHETFTGLIRLRLKVWGDRWVCVDAGFLQKRRWAWESALQGRFVGQDGGRGLVRMIEETMSVSRSADSAVPNLIEEVWEKSLAKGPKVV